MPPSFIVPQPKEQPPAAVEGFSHNTRYQGGGFPVAKHFNLPNFGRINIMRVSVIKQNTGGTLGRQHKERHLIHIDPRLKH